MSFFYMFSAPLFINKDLFHFLCFLLRSTHTIEKEEIKNIDTLIITFQ